MRNLKILVICLLSVTLFFSCSRDAKNKRAQEKGQTLVEKEGSFIKGVGDGLKGVGKDAAESISEGVGEVLKGSNEGFDKSLIKKEVRVSEGLKDFLKATRCEISQSDSIQKKELIVYIIFEKDFDGKLVLKAFDNNDKEIARSAVEVKEKSNNSRFVEFPFDNRTAFDLIQYLTLE